MLLNNVSPAVVEETLRQVNEPNVQLTNPWLLQYAESIVGRLTEGT